jgi:diketogulonate reductase-like aldo/keto reductase
METPDEDDLSSEIEKLHSRGKIMEVGKYRSILNLPKNVIFEEKTTTTLSEFKVSPASIKALTNQDFESDNVTEMLKVEYSDLPLNPGVLSKMSTKYNLSEKQLVLCWLINHPRHYHPVLKLNSIDSLDITSRAMHTKMISEDWKKFAEKI